MEGPSSQLTSEKHPFFRELFPLSVSLKSFCDQVPLPNEILSRNVLFHGLSIGCSFFEAFSVIVVRLKRYTLLTITTETISDIAEGMVI